jgi:hypothetical protein
VSRDVPRDSIEHPPQPPQEHDAVTPFELRPLAIGELLDRVFSLYKRHLSTFVGIMAVPALFNLLLALGMLTLQHLRGGPLFTPGQKFDSPELMTSMLQLFGVIILAVIIYWIAYMLAVGATTIAIAEVYAGRDVGIGGAYARARQQLGRLLLLAILWWLVIVLPSAVIIGIGAGFAIAMRQSAAAVIGILFVFIGLLALFVASVYISLRFAVAAPALILENVSAPTALRRSVFLTQGYIGRVFLLLLCSALLAYTSIMLFQMPFNVASMLAGKFTAIGFWLDMAGVICGTIGQILTAPIMVIGVAVLYYDFRVRKEALDLQLMISALDSQDGGLSMTPPPSPALHH